MKTSGWGLGLAALAALAGCGGLALEPSPPGAGPPREIRQGRAEMATQRVESEVSRAEIASAVAAMVAAARTCVPWPALWLDAEQRRSVFHVRYDLMRRDWGAEVAAASEARMQEFVEGGFLSRRERLDLGAGAATYALTPEGAEALRGSPYGGGRPQFCGASGRRLGEITALEWGEFACGNLRVGFTHVADDWPAWARTESMRARVLQAWGPLGTPAPGSVTLSRQWYQRAALPRGRQNGALRSVCYGARDDGALGNDLNLNAHEVGGDGSEAPAPAGDLAPEGS
jgi:hypothetical protein